MSTPRALVLVAICASSWGAAPAAGAGGTLLLNAVQREALGIVVAPADRAERTIGPALPAQVVVPNTQLRIVSAPCSGLVEELLVAAGDAIEEGKPLARIRSPELLQIEREYLELRSRAELAAANADRDRRLFAEGLVAQRRFLEAAATQQQAAAALAERRQALVLAGLDAAALERLTSSGDLTSLVTVTSPLEAIVLAQSVTVGERVRGADPHDRLGDLSSLWLEIHAPVERLDGIAPGTPVTIPALGLEATVVAVGRAVHEADQGVTVRAEIADGAEQLRPGQFVSVRLRPAAASRSVYRVPLAAVVRVGEASYVFLAQPEGFVPVAVQVLEEEPRSAVVEALLPAAAEIAVQGAAALKSMWVRGGD